jgi:hypothetical protein
VWEQRKTDFDLDVVEGGRARGSFAPDKRESVSTLIKNPPPGAPAPPIMPPVDGYLLLDNAKFPASFAGDVSPEKAAFMADSQVQEGVNALDGTVSEPAWKPKPSWKQSTWLENALSVEVPVAQ